MGIIQKQSFQSSFFLGIGIFLGLVTSGLLLPNYLSEEENGLLILLNSYSLFYSQIAILGINTVVIRFYPYFKDEKFVNNGLLSAMSLFSFIGFLLFFIYYLVSKPFFENLFEKSPLFKENYYYLVPLTFFSLYYYLFDAYSTAQSKTVRGFLLKDVIQRILILLILVVYIIWQYQFQYFLLTYIISMCIPTLMFVYILLNERQFTFKIRFGKLYRENRGSMIKVAGYSMLLGISWVGISNLDAIFIERLMDDGLNYAGIYGRNMVFGILVSFPYRTIHKISSVILSSSFKEGNIENVKNVYYKSTITQLIIGCFIFTGIWLNIDNVYHIIPPSYASGKYVIFFIGLSNLITMSGGVNTAVISFSPYYRWNTIFVVALLFLTVGTNFIFIPWMGITGAAMATVISISLYNLMMYVFLWYKYGFQPFNFKHLFVLILTALCFFLSNIIPILPHFIMDIFVRSIAFTLLFVPAIILSKVSTDVNNMVLFLWKKGLGMITREKPEK